MAEEKKREGYFGILRERSGKLMFDKKLMAIVGGAAAIIIIALLVVYFGTKPQPQADLELSDDALPVNSEDEEDEDGEILPQTERLREEEIGQTRSRDPFSSPPELQGLISGGGGENLAIIKTSNATYVAARGDLIEEYWTVEEVTEEKAVLSSEDEEFALIFGEEELPDRVEPEPETDPEEADSNEEDAEITEDNTSNSE